MSSGGGNVARILYKELVGGDLRKLEAKSNDTPSGGGARDFRFRSYDDLLPVIEQMFPQKSQETRTRNKQRVTIDVLKGWFYWQDKSTGKVTKKESTFEPPTSAREGEGRIARIHQYPCFDAGHVAIKHGNRILLLLVQLDDGSVWPYYAEESSIRTPGLWDPRVARELIDCIDAKRRKGTAVLGYRDFTNAKGFCNGK
ncbi:hypothetical protein [Marinobacter sp. SS8-8]|uniref:hypothetical protein n=1 Tax=Marinobacter sp. SS8-8 TaxID=3050452 RepID=UPI0026E0DB38|nr:hypothetical protein [Marinobacter sp. SS8-8]